MYAACLTLPFLKAESSQYCLAVSPTCCRFVGEGVARTETGVWVLDNPRETPPHQSPSTNFLAVEWHFSLFPFPLIVQVYQIYAKRSPEDVHALLRSFGADYVILEDSICYERRHQRGCRLRDLLDIANGHVSLSPRPGRDSWGRGSSRNLYTLQNDDMNQVPSFTAFCGTPGSGTSVMAVGTAEGTDEGASCQIEQLCLQLICILRLCITSIF